MARESIKYNGMMEMDALFYERVYAQVAKIPLGRVSTYGKIGQLAGYPGASREVGLAMGRMSPGTGLACHRVVNKNGTLAPDHVFGGRDKQEKLLREEGVAFHEDGTINMQRHMWPDDSPVEQLTFM